MWRKAVAFSLVFWLLLEVGCAPHSAEPQSSPLPPTQLQHREELPQPAPQRITLLAAGDNLIHDVIYQQASSRAGGSGYDFLPAYSAVQPLIQAADLAIINQETLLASAVAPVSSYPRFCSPVELGEQLLEVGFDVFTQANNHSYDQGAAGIRAVMEFWDAHPKGLPVGLYRNEAERDRLRYTTVKGVKLAFLAATELTNGLELAADAPEGVFLLSQEDILRRQLAEARKNADFVVISPHWGVEGADWVSDEQKAMAHRLVEWGADLVLGCHPHMLQPCETITREDGSTGLVIYSMGNFISAQRGRGNMAGGLLEVTVEQEPGAHGRIVNYRLIPTVTHYGASYTKLRVLPFDQYTPELAAAHGVNAYQPGFSMDYLTRLYEKIYPDCLASASKMELTSQIGAPVTAGQEAPLLNAALDALCQRDRVVGMSVAAFRGGEVVYTHSYGYANRERKLPAAQDTIYRAASIAKAVTTMAALQLYDRGELELDGDISAYTGVKLRNPNYPHIPLTTRQLLTHTSGIVDSQGYYDAITRYPFGGLSQLVKRNIYSDYAPGAHYTYSNLSMGMVGGVAGGISGEPIWALARSRLFDPLGLSASYLSQELPQERLASIYQDGEKTFDPAVNGTAARHFQQIPPGELYLLGQGDLYITASQLAKLGMVLAGDGVVGGVRILKADTVQELHRVQLHAPAEKAGEADIYRGLGVQLFPELLPGERFAGHQGNAYGMIGCLLYRPGKGDGIAFLTNGCRAGKRDGVVYDINREVAQLIYSHLLDQ